DVAVRGKQTHDHPSTSNAHATQENSSASRASSVRPSPLEVKQRELIQLQKSGMFRSCGRYPGSIGRHAASPNRNLLASADIAA
ncbi:hypothetical protein ABTD07_19785, partial [Acinetobacter baumannii]